MIPVPTQENFLESLPKHFVENSVKYRVDHGAGVAEPRDEIEHPFVDIPLAFGTDRRYQVQDEEGCPQDDESEKHHTQHLGGFLF